MGSENAPERSDNLALERVLRILHDSICVNACETRDGVLAQDYVRALAAERDQALAMVGAVIGGVINEACGLADGRDEADYIERMLRGCVPADATAALAARDARIREEAMRAAAGMCEPGDLTHYGPEPYLICRDRILAAIQSGDA